MPADLVPVLASGLFHGIDQTVRHAVETATGPLGLLLIGLYSFLIAFVLPLPSELVLAPATRMHLGIGTGATLGLIMLVSGIGKAVGSLFAFHIGQEAKQSGPVIRFLRQSRFDVLEWSEKTTVQLVQRFGYVGLAIMLSIPFFPDTISIYAFSVLQKDYYRFAAATFVGSVGRLVITLLGIAGAISIV
ncbi:MAG: YqaA family protein [Halapricum sp.]